VPHTRLFTAMMSIAMAMRVSVIVLTAILLLRHGVE
jgi:hypothetical protein